MEVSRAQLGNCLWHLVRIFRVMAEFAKSGAGVSKPVPTPSPVDRLHQLWARLGAQAWGSGGKEEGRKHCEKWGSQQTRGRRGDLAMW